MRRTGRTPIDDDAEKAEIRPLEASVPLSIKGTLSTDEKSGIPLVIRSFFPLSTDVIPEISLSIRSISLISTDAIPGIPLSSVVFL